MASEGGARPGGGGGGDSSRECEGGGGDSSRECEGEWSSLTLEGLRQNLDAFAELRDWRQFHTPRNVMLALVGEVGELCECFQWRTAADCAGGLAGFKPDQSVHVGEELADVCCYCVRLADVSGLDVAQSLLPTASRLPDDGAAESSADFETLRARARAAVAAAASENAAGPRDLALALAAQAGRLSATLSGRRCGGGEASGAPGLAGWDDTARASLTRELGDALVLVAACSHAAGIDLPGAVRICCCVGGVVRACVSLSYHTRVAMIWVMMCGGGALSLSHAWSL